MLYGIRIVPVLTTAGLYGTLKVDREKGTERMYCMHCGAKNPDSAKYCNNCGKPMKRAPSPKSSGFDWELLISVVVLIGAVIFLLNWGLDMISGGISVVKNWIGDRKEESSYSVTEEYNPAGDYTPSLTGTWQEVRLQDGNSNLNVNALVFPETVSDCTAFTVMMDVTMNAGTKCKDWQVWGRSSGSFVKIGKVYLPDGDGYVSQQLTFDSPISFDAIAITPTAKGGYSWSMGLSITDVITR